MFNLTTILQDIKKIQQGKASLDELEEYLDVKNVGLLYSAMYQIAKNNIDTPTIKNKLIRFSTGENEFSNQGIGLFTMRIIALATLVKLNEEIVWDDLNEEDKQVLERFLSDKSWSNI